MGLLLDVDTGRVHALPTRALIGRAGHCAIRLGDPRVSSEHGVLGWRDGWWYRDLGSRNGSALDGAVVAAGEDLAVAAGAELRVADRVLRLVDAGPPSPQATHLGTGRVVSAPGRALLLPGEGAPGLAVFPDADGVWVREDAQGAVAVVDGEVVGVGGEAWRLHLPTGSEATLDAAEALTAAFLVSPDEERVRVELTLRERVHRLGPKGHHYALLVLARARLDEAGRPQAERGWVHREALARMLRCDPITVNVHLHRIRQDLGTVPLEGAQGLVEVRPRTGLVRFGLDRAEIRRVVG